VKINNKIKNNKMKNLITPDKKSKLIFEKGTEGLFEIARRYKPPRKEIKQEETKVPEEVIQEPFTNPNIDSREYLQIPGTTEVISYLELQGYNKLNYKDTHFKLSENGLYMPTPGLFIPHFVNVIDCFKQNKPLYFADGKEVPRRKIEDLYNHLTKDHIAVYKDSGGAREGVWTWLNAGFEKQGEDWFIKIGRVENKKLEFESQSLENKIWNDCYVNLKFNSQGMPLKKSGNSYKQGKNLRFWYPRDGSVACFFAYSDRAFLGCYRNPGYSNDSLGVFGCAKGTTP